MCRPLHVLVLFCSLFIGGMASAQVTIGVTNYPTLKAAFDAINAGTHTGAVTISITGNTTETATAVLNASGNGPASYTSVSINATAAATITSNLAVATIQLNGADNVNLNGNSTLQIINTHSTGAVISLVNDASNNKIRNTTITGNTASFTVSAGNVIINAGVITFGEGVTTGNNGNLVDNCDINGNNQAICLVYSKGLTTSSTTTNYQDTVRNSRLYNYMNPTVAAATAISIAGSDEWMVQNNSIYFTAPVTTSQQLILRAILITPNFTSDNHTVTGNFFGGNAPSAAGSLSVTATGINVIGLIGIDVETGGTGNIVSNNAIKNISISYNSSNGSFANAAYFGFIGGYNGTTTFSGNETSNLSFVNNGGYVNLSIMHFNGRITAAGTVTPVFNITNNIITNITANSGGAAGDVNLNGIRLEASSAASLTSTAIANPTFNVTGNTVSGISVPFAGVTATYVRGIGTVTTQGTSATALLYPKVNITSNTIHSLSTASTLANYGSGVATGIHFAGGSATTAPDVQVISQNTIYNLSATNTGNFGAVVIGILATTGLHDINRNRIYDLKNAAVPTGATSPGIVGITVRNATGTSTTANNFISLGTGVTEGVQVFGFLHNFTTATGPVNVYHNSIYIGGTAGSGDKRSAAVVRGTELFGTGVATPFNLKNNILYNTRTGGGGSHYAVVNSHSTPATGFTSDANVMYTVNPFTLAMWGSTNNDLATYKTNSGDANSKTTTVTFANVATGDLHLAGSSVGDNNLGAAPVPGILIDYDGATRSATRVYIGADEASVVLPVQLSVFAGYKVGSVNKLTWTTASEANNRGFELQRSADGKNFSTIAVIASKAEAGNSNSPITYSFDDEMPLKGNNYYRLKQIDMDGRSSLSIIVAIKGDKTSLGITSLYPNPAKDIVNLAVTSPVSGKATIVITGLSGNVISQVPATVIAGQNNLSINVGSLPTGVYLVRITNGSETTETMRFIKH